MPYRRGRLRDVLDVAVIKQNPAGMGFKE